MSSDFVVFCQENESIFLNLLVTCKTIIIIIIEQFQMCDA